MTGNHGFKELAPKIKLLEISETRPTGFILDMLVNVTNPTNYSASVPFIKIQMLCNNTVLANISTVGHLNVKPGRNDDLSMSLEWDPVMSSGETGARVAKELLSQYLSG